jgi:hypothetical protein
MKKYILSFLLLSLMHGAFAQTPQGITYQAVARNASGQLLAITPVKVRFSIRDSIANGNIVYQETHIDTTDALGLFDLVIGNGTPTSGTFAGINWGSNKKYIQVEFDANVGSYTNLGTQQMMSVPYALYAEKAGKSKSNYANGITQGNTYQLTMSNPETLYPGYMLLMNADSANTGTASVSINNATPISIKKSGSADLSAGDISAKQVVMLVFDGSVFQYINIPGASSSATDNIRTLIYTTKGF